MMQWKWKCDGMIVVNVLTLVFTTKNNALAIET